MKKLEVKKSKVDGVGIYTKEKIKKGEHIAFIKGRLVKKVIKNKKDAQSIPLWYGITESLWIDPMNTIWRYFNHGCEPNTAIIGTRKLIALRAIKEGEEILFDYSMTDGDVLWDMKCSCGSKKCRKIIRSIQLIDQETFKNHLPFIPSYFINLRKRYLKSAKI